MPNSNILTTKKILRSINIFYTFSKCSWKSEKEMAMVSVAVHFIYGERYTVYS